MDSIVRMTRGNTVGLQQRGHDNKLRETGKAFPTLGADRPHVHPFLKTLRMQEMTARSQRVRCPGSLACEHGSQEVDIRF